MSNFVIYILTIRVLSYFIDFDNLQTTVSANSTENAGNNYYHDIII